MAQQMARTLWRPLVELARAVKPAHVLVGSAGATIVGSAAADEAEEGLEVPNYPWPHESIFSAYDAASIRRGFQVYQQVRRGFVLVARDGSLSVHILNPERLGY